MRKVLFAVLPMLTVILISGCTQTDTPETPDNPSTVRSISAACEGRSYELKILNWDFNTGSQSSSFTIQNTMATPIVITYVMSEGDLGGETGNIEIVLQPNETYRVYGFDADGSFSMARIAVNYDRSNGIGGVVNFVCKPK